MGCLGSDARRGSLLRVDIATKLEISSQPLLGARLEKSSYPEMCATLGCGCITAILIHLRLKCYGAGNGHYSLALKLQEECSLEAGILVL